jgi:dipeptidyl aminopeptidase/acylaminoacyl peptidase
MRASTRTCSRKADQADIRPSPGRTLTRWMVRRIVNVSIILILLLVFLRMTGCAENLFYHPRSKPPLEPVGFPVESIYFESVDGTRLHGWFIPAAAVHPEHAPTIVQVHGNAGNIEDHLPYTEFLPSNGYNLFIFDYRGYGLSQGRATRRGPLIDDTHAALDYLLSRDDVNPDRIGMYGQSLGGAIGLLTMARRDEIRCAIIVSAFSSFRDVAADALGGNEPGFIARSIARFLIDDAHRPIDAARAIGTRPILIVHGDADRTVRVKHGRALHQAASNARYIELAGGDHTSLRWEFPDLDRQMLEFFDQSLADQPIE